MPSKSKKADKVPKSRIPPVRNYTIDLTVLDDDEQEVLDEVIQRDNMLNKAVDEKLSNLRRDIQSIRKAGALTGKDKQHTICARCKYRFWLIFVPFVDHGTRCYNCKFKVCRKCRYLQVNNLYLCSLCLKQRQEKWLTGEWLHGGQCRGLFGSDLLQASLRDKEYFQTLRNRYFHHQTLLENNRTKNSNASQNCKKNNGCRETSLVDFNKNSEKSICSTIMEIVENREKTLKKQNGRDRQESEDKQKSEDTMCSGDGQKSEHIEAKTDKQIIIDRESMMTRQKGLDKKTTENKRLKTNIIKRPIDNDLITEMSRDTVFCKNNLKGFYGNKTFNQYIASSCSDGLNFQKRAENPCRKRLSLGQNRYNGQELTKKENILLNTYFKQINLHQQKQISSLSREDERFVKPLTKSCDNYREYKRKSYSQQTGKFLQKNNNRCEINYNLESKYNGRDLDKKLLLRLINIIKLYRKKYRRLLIYQDKVYNRSKVRRLLRNHASKRNKVEKFNNNEDYYAKPKNSEKYHSSRYLANEKLLKQRLKNKYLNRKKNIKKDMTVEVSSDEEINKYIVRLDKRKRRKKKQVEEKRSFYYLQEKNFHLNQESGLQYKDMRKASNASLDCFLSHEKSFMPTSNICNIGQKVGAQKRTIQETQAEGYLDCNQMGIHDLTKEKPILLNKVIRHPRHWSTNMKYSQQKKSDQVNERCTNHLVKAESWNDKPGSFTTKYKNKKELTYNENEHQIASLFASRSDVMMVVKPPLSHSKCNCVEDHEYHAATSHQNPKLAESQKSQSGYATCDSKEERTIQISVDSSFNHLSSHEIDSNYSFNPKSPKQKKGEIQAKRQKLIKEATTKKASDKNKQDNWEKNVLDKDNDSKKKWGNALTKFTQAAQLSKDKYDDEYDDVVLSYQSPFSDEDNPPFLIQPRKSSAYNRKSSMPPENFPRKLTGTIEKPPFEFKDTIDDYSSSEKTVSRKHKQSVSGSSGMPTVSVTSQTKGHMRPECFTYLCPFCILSCIYGHEWGY